MPPRHAYWTILIDNKPTAFRAREKEELQPTFHQLQRKNANAEMRWFARGRLWETQEAEREDFQRRKRASAGPYERSEGKLPAGAPAGDAPRRRDADQRGKDWRPGGAHKDPRDRFKKKNRPDRMWSAKGSDREKPEEGRGFKPAEGGAKKPWSDKPAGPPRGDRPWTNKSAGGGDKRPWNKKPAGPPRSDRPWSSKPPSGDRKPWSKPAGGDRRPWRDKPAGGPPRSDRPWSTKPPSGDRRPWSKPADGDRKPWRDKPAGPDATRVFRPAGGGGDRKPWNNKPAGAPRGDSREARRSSTDRQSSGGGWSKPPQGKRPWSAGPPPWRDRPRPDARTGERRSADAPPVRPKEPTPPPSPEQIRTKPKPPERG